MPLAIRAVVQKVARAGADVPVHQAHVLLALGVVLERGAGAQVEAGDALAAAVAVVLKAEFACKVLGSAVARLPSDVRALVLLIERAVTFMHNVARQIMRNDSDRRTSGLKQ